MKTLWIRFKPGVSCDRTNDFSKNVCVWVQRKKKRSFGCRKTIPDWCQNDSVLLNFIRRKIYFSWENHCFNNGLSTKEESPITMIISPYNPLLDPDYFFISQIECCRFSKTLLLTFTLKQMSCFGEIQM